MINQASGTDAGGQPPADAPSPPRPSTALRCLHVLLPLLGCGLLGLFAAAVLPANGSPDRWPAPWRMPAYPGMGSLRLVMVHDVLSERFVTHGAAFHEARLRGLLAQLPADPAAALDATQLPLVDDLGVSLDRLGRSAEAVTWFRRKAAAQELPWPPPATPVDDTTNTQILYVNDLGRIAERGTLTEADHQRYTTWANLGTVVIHANLRAALAGDDAARQEVAHGIAALRAAVAIDPTAHFGRERWQIILAEHLLAAARDPTLLRRFDAGGEPLVEGTDDPDDHNRRAMVATFGIRAWSKLVPGGPPGDHRFRPDATAEAADRGVNDSQREMLRHYLTPVGASSTWVTAVAPSWRAPAAWDQPVLGALGLWTLGGGASPHLALWLANTCETIGQRHLALEAWWRVEELAERYSTDPATVVWLRQHAAARSAALATTLGLDDAALAARRSRFQAELTWARAQRTAHETWEAAQLAAGIAPGDPALDAWVSTPPLASDPGDADEIHTDRRAGLDPLGAACCVLLGAGIGAWLGILAWRDRGRRTITSVSLVGWLVFVVLAFVVAGTVLPAI